MNGWQIAIGLVLLAHGLGHLLGIWPALGVGKSLPRWNTHSWLLDRVIGKQPATALAVLLWSVSVVGFVVAAAGVAGLGVPAGAWRPIAVASAALSLVTLALFWNGFPVFFPNKLGAIAVNVFTLVAILVRDWPSDELLGR